MRPLPRAMYRLDASSFALCALVSPCTRSIGARMGLETFVFVREGRSAFLVAGKNGRNGGDPFRPGVQSRHDASRGLRTEPKGREGEGTQQPSGGGGLERGVQARRRQGDGNTTQTQHTQHERNTSYATRTDTRDTQSQGGHNADLGGRLDGRVAVEDQRNALRLLTRNLNASTQLPLRSHRRGGDALTNSVCLANLFFFCSLAICVVRQAGHGSWMQVNCPGCL